MRHVVLDSLDDLSNHAQPMESTLTWQLVDQVASDLGAGEAARRKWRGSGRQVPYEWRIKIAEDLLRRGVAIPLSEFDRLPAKPGKIAA